MSEMACDDIENRHKAKVHFVRLNMLMQDIGFHHDQQIYLMSDLKDKQ